ncbi:MAG: ribose 5-phosphate isomerase B [Pseudobdellovibrionaceae bacterium]|nr:ribose 5-phosphate isomerase B [Pseudobdellovibrionaceae bacterium]
MGSQNTNTNVFSSIVIGCDHAGLSLKQELIHYLKKKSLPIVDVGTSSSDPVDYPDFAYQLAQKLKDHSESLGILICGTGQGMAMAANRFSHIRAAVVWNEESARLARAHNNANVLCLGGRLWSVEQAIQFFDIFLSTPFEGGRHFPRIQKLGKEGS